MEQRKLEEIKSAIKKANDILNAATTTANERELILKPLNLLQEKENFLLTRALAPPPTTVKSLSAYKWKGYTQNSLFPINFFGSKVIDRKRLINLLIDEIAIQKKILSESAVSIYIPGTRGMGKTSLLMLLATELTEQGYEVYFFEEPGVFASGELVEELHKYVCYDGMAYTEATDKKVAVLIDEIHSNPFVPVYIGLLKNMNKNLVVIGSALTKLQHLNAYAQFNKVVTTNVTAFEEDDTDFLQLIEECKKLAVTTTPESTEFICKTILRRCGGHVYPTLKFIEYYFMTEEGLRCFTKEGDEVKHFIRHFDGPKLMESDIYKSVVKQCFSDFIDGKTRRIVNRVMGGNQQPGDNTALARLGLWDTDTNSFVSDFQKNFFLSGNIELQKDNLKYLSASKSPEENTEDVIVTGFHFMEQIDFNCLAKIDSVPIADALSYNWAIKVLSHFPNAFLRFQESSKVEGHVDFYLNGYVDTAIEFIRNARKQSPKAKEPRSTDMDKHLERFISRNKIYHWNNFVIVNFAMTGDKLILPDNAAYHEKVYTYLHATNSLYRGSTKIKVPAVASLPCPTPPVPYKYTAPNSIGLKGRTSRQFSTFIQKLLH